jgi:hypothetical protein
MRDDNSHEDCKKCNPEEEAPAEETKEDSAE